MISWSWQMHLQF